jgi:glycopeptide antibiotics resistance protein
MSWLPEQGLKSGIDKAVRILAWSSLLAIFVITDGPIAFRPVTIFSPNVERFCALLVVGTLFGFAYPRRTLMIAAVVLAGIFMFELLQLIWDSRHASIYDVVYKSAGAMVGLMIGKSVMHSLRKPSAGLS